MITFVSLRKKKHKKGRPEHFYLNEHEKRKSEPTFCLYVYNPENKNTGHARLVS